MGAHASKIGGAPSGVVGFASSAAAHAGELVKVGALVRDLLAAVASRDNAKVSHLMDELRAVLSSGGLVSGGLVTGGGEAFGGSVKGIGEFAESESAATKASVVRMIARALKDAGVSVDPDAELETVVRRIGESLPNPYDARPGKASSFSSDAEAQKSICRAVAAAFNNRFTPGAKGDDRLVNGETAPEICRQVAMLARSFTAATSVEFLDAYAGLRSSMEDLKLIVAGMNAAEADIVASLQASGDPELLRKVDPVHAVYEGLRAEQRRRLLALEQHLSLELPPVTKILARVNDEDLTADRTLSALFARLGTSDFGDGIAATLLGVHRAATTAQVVHSALGKLGLQIRDFLDSPSFRELRAKALALAKEHPEKMAATLHQIEELGTPFTLRTDPALQEALSELEGGRRTGGAPPKSAIEKRIKQVKDDKAVLLNAFTADLGQAYRAFLGAVKELAPKLGKEIPLTEGSDRLREAIARLAEVRAGRKPIEAALIGTYNDADARERKSRFLSALGLVVSACDALAPLAIYRESSSDFARIRKAVEDISRTIDTFARAMETRFGGAEVAGGADEEVVALESNFNGLSSSITEAVQTFIYQYYVAKVRENLAQTASELDGYGETYEALLGDAVAAKLFTIEGRRVAWEGLLVPSAALARASSHGDAAEIAWLPAAPPAGAAGAPEQALAQVKAHITAMFAAKKRFYRALEAVDLYLKAFSRGLARDPDAVRPIKTMLEGTQVIARWFSETTGDRIWQAFENFRAMGANVAVVGSVEPAAGAAVRTAAAGANAPHYYELAGVRRDETSFGVPELGQRPSNGTLSDDPVARAKAAVSEAVDFYQGLKNLINAFVRIGDEFGGATIRSQVFMSPGQIYKTLIDYLKVSAIEINFPWKDDLDEVRSKHFRADAVSTAAADLANRNRGGIGVHDIALNAALAAGVADTGRVLNATRPFTASFPECTDASRFFAEEDKYFAGIIKAMGAKILTTLGVFDMLERTTPVYDLTPTRMILGGGSAVPIPEATELYFRLPRLAEFYRGFLRWDGSGVQDTEEFSGVRYKIAMLPELEGVFSGLIAQVFVQAASPMSGEYSEAEMDVLIEEINRIYTFFAQKDPDRPVKAAIAAFVIEVNRRFGLIKAKDMQEYWDLVKLSRSGQADSVENTTNFSILPGEDEMEVARKAPSDRFGVAPFQRFDAASGRPIDPATGAPVEPFTTRIGLNAAAETLLRNFRKNLEDSFRTGHINFGAGFSGLIRQAGEEMMLSTGAGARLKVAYRLIQDGQLAQAGDTRLLAFHETVVTGLNLLSGIEAIVRRTSALVSVMNPITIEKAIMDTCQLLVSGARVVDGIVDRAGPAYGALAANRAALLAAIAARLPQYAAGPNNMGADIGGAVTWFDRYLHSEAAYVDGRGGMTLVANGTYAAFYTFLAAEIGAARVDVLAGDNLAGVDAGADQATSLPSQFFFTESGEDLVDATNGTVSVFDRTAELGRAGVNAGHPNAAEATAQRRFLCAARTAARGVVNYSLIMEDFVEMLSALCAGGMVEVRFTRAETGASGVQLNFSKLRSLSEALLSSVKRCFETFRPHLPKDLLDRFELGKFPGSIFWLEENLMDKRFRGTPPTLSPDTVDGISRRAGAVLKALTRQTSMSFTGMNDADLVGGNALARLPAIMRLTQDPACGAVVPHDAGHIGGATEWYGTTFAGNVFWNCLHESTRGHDAQSRHDMGLGEPVVINRAGLVEGLINLRPSNADNVFNDGNRPAGADNRLVPTWTAPGEANRSIIFTFNRLVATLVASVSDGGNPLKIYSPLLEGITSGILSSSVMDPISGNVVPDCRANAGNTITTGFWGDPRAGTILVQSLACVFQRLMNDKTGTAMVPKYLVSTLTDVPAHTKEALRANLPVLIAHFSALRAKCDFLREFLQRNENILLTRPDIGTALALSIGAPILGDTCFVTRNAAGRQQYPVGAVGVGGVGVATGLYPVAAPEASSGETLRTRIYDVLNSVSTACYAASSSAENTLRELGDQPRFFQTQEGFIENFRLRHGKDPIMPLSLALSFLGDVEIPADGRARIRLAAPGATYCSELTKARTTVGTSEFRLLYGHRGIVFGTAEPTADSVPWLKSLMADYSRVAPGEPVSDEAVWKYAKEAVAALRWLVGVRAIASKLAKTDALPIGTTVGPAGNKAATIVRSVRSVENAVLNYADGIVWAPTGNALRRNSVFSLQGGGDAGVHEASVGAVGLLSVAENSNQEAEVKKIVDSLGSAPGRGSGGRNAQRIHNLLDMNIIPINVHALMREIPLANLYNYSMTFEQQVANALGIHPSPPDRAVPVPVTSAEFEAQMIRDPFMEVTDAQYGTADTTMASHALVGRMFRGEGGTGMGRPRFLSDQVFNKALFGSVYPDAEMVDETGPRLPPHHRPDAVRELYNVLVNMERIAGVLVAHGEMFLAEARIAAEAVAALARAEALNVVGLHGAIYAPNGAPHRYALAIDRHMAAYAVVAAYQGLAAGWDVAERGRVIAAAGAFAAAAGQREIQQMLIAPVSDEGIYARVLLQGERGAAFEAARRGLEDIMVGQVQGSFGPESLWRDVRTVIGAWGAFWDSDVQVRSLPGMQPIHALVEVLDDAYGEHIINGNPTFDARTNDAGARAQVPAARPGPPWDNHGNIMAELVAGRAVPAAWNPTTHPGSWIHLAGSFYRLMANPQHRANILQALRSRGVVGARIARTLPVVPMLNRVPDVGLLTYMKDEDETHVLQRVPITGVQALVLSRIGKARFDTTFIRKLVLITNVHRIVRRQLGRTLAQDRSVILRSHASVAPGVTEYGFDPYTPNEVSDSRPRDLNLGMARNAQRQWPEDSASRWLDGRK